jgi:DNA-binding IclR family transcriptional regulator
MAQLAPSVVRVISVLNFFAEHPDSAFSLTEVVRALKLSRATCHSLLRTLSHAGYLYCDAGKRYRIGPTLATIGRISSRFYLPVAAARDEMRQLSDRLDLICMAAGRVGTDMVILERTVSRSNLAPLLPLDRHFKLDPPIGIPFIAWGPPEELTAWLDAFRPPLSKQDRHLVIDVVKKIREMGITYTIHSPHDGKHDPLLRANGGSPCYFVAPAAELSGVMRKIEKNKKYNVGPIVVPITDSADNVLFQLSLLGFKNPISGAEICNYGRELQEARRRISASVSKVSIAVRD